MTLDRHCENCETKLSADASFCLSCGASTPSGEDEINRFTKFDYSDYEERVDLKCSKCGNDNPENAQFCGGCGLPLVIPAISGPQAGSHELPMVEFIEAIKRAFQNYFKFSGRATRAEYWWFVLFTQVVGIIGVVPIIGWIISPLVSIGCIIPSISLTVRRLHDIGKSGWWLMSWVVIAIFWVVWIIQLIRQLIGLEDSKILEEELWEMVFKGLITEVIILTLVSVATCIWFLVWFIWKGDKGPNKYGPDPRQPITS